MIKDLDNVNYNLACIAKAIEDNSNIDVDTDTLEDTIQELSSSIQQLNDDFNEKMEQLIEVLTNGK